MSKLSDKIKQAKKSIEIREEFKDIKELKEKRKQLRENGKVISKPILVNREIGKNQLVRNIIKMLNESRTNLPIEYMRALEMNLRLFSKRK